MPFDDRQAYVAYYLEQFLEPLLRDPSTTPAQRDILLALRARLQAGPTEQGPTQPT